MSGHRVQEHQSVSGAAIATDTGVHTLIAAPSMGKLCITSLQVGRTDAGTTPITVTLNDLAGTVLVIDNPGSGRSIPFVFDTPLIWPLKTAATFQSSAGVTTLYASAQGFLFE